MTVSRWSLLLLPLALVTSFPAFAEELDARVVRVSRHRIWLQKHGAVIPFQVGRDTQLVGVGALEQLRAGTLVHATFEVRGAKNHATKLSRHPNDAAF